MFREIRRKKQTLTTGECEKILQEGTSGVLAVSGDGGYPYTVPLSYISSGDKIYFHCARSGHKIDAIQRDEKASFCVIGQDHVMPERFTTYYKSVIIFGRIKIIDDEVEKRRVLKKLCSKYAPSLPDGQIQGEIDAHWSSLCILGLSIEHMSGKCYR